MSKRVFSIITLLIIVAGLYGLYSFPIQKYDASKSFEDYTTRQGIKEENIKEKRILKDYKRNGYTMEIICKDNPNIMYEYIYRGENLLKKTLPYKKILCIIYDETGDEIIDNKVKYPRLPEN